MLALARRVKGDFSDPVGIILLKWVGGFAEIGTFPLRSFMPLD